MGQIATQGLTRYFIVLPAQHGASFIKVYPSLSWPLKRAVADEAHRLGLPFVGRGMTAEEVIKSVPSGSGAQRQDDLEGILVPTPGSDGGGGFLHHRSLDAQGLDEVPRALSTAFLFKDSIVPPTYFVGRFFFPGIVVDAAQMEGVFRESGLDWTIVRPPRLTDKPYTGNVACARAAWRDSAFRFREPTPLILS